MAHHQLPDPQTYPGAGESDRGPPCSHHHPKNDKNNVRVWLQVKDAHARLCQKKKKKGKQYKGTPCWSLVTTRLHPMVSESISTRTSCPLRDPVSSSLNRWSPSKCLMASTIVSKFWRDVAAR